MYDERGAGLDSVPAPVEETTPAFRREATPSQPARGVADHGWQAAEQSRQPVKTIDRLLALGSPVRRLRIACTKIDLRFSGLLRIEATSHQVGGIERDLREPKYHRGSGVIELLIRCP